MLARNFRAYLDAAPDNTEICVAVRSVDTGAEIAVSFDLAVDIDEYGDLMIVIAL